MSAPLTARDLERIHSEVQRDGRWNEVDKPLVQRELLDACWQAVLDAVRAESRAEIMRLSQRVRDLEAVAIAAVEAAA
jgi:hypothetical protein